MKMRSLLAAAMVVSSTAAFAAPIPFDIDVSASVPDTSGLDVYAVGGWDTAPLKMSFNRDTGALGTVGGQLSIKGGGEGVEAYLVDAPVMISGSNRIGLTAAIGGVALKMGATNKVEVASKTEAAAGKRAQLVIAAAAAPTGGYAVGEYAGPVNIMFDSMPPI